MSNIFPVFRTGRYNTKQDPFSLTSLVDDLFTLDLPSRTHRNYNTTPRANVVKTEHGYAIEMAAPGFSRDEFEMSVEDNRLSIEIRTEDTKEYEDKLVHREYRFHNFKRSFSLPDNANVDSISARYEAGILYVEVPVDSNGAKKRTITVE